VLPKSTSCNPNHSLELINDGAYDDPSTAARPCKRRREHRRGQQGAHLAHSDNFLYCSRRDEKPSQSRNTNAAAGLKVGLVQAVSYTVNSSSFCSTYNLSLQAMENIMTLLLEFNFN
jgi:hypothetical protein